MYNIKIIYYDKNIIIINKPFGIEISKVIKNKIKNNLPNNGILNRLDKYTSGIILIARNFLFYFYYKKLILSNFIKKKYIAITEKTFIKGFINLSIFKKKNIFIKKYKKKSLSYYKIIKNTKKINFNYIYIKTGRTHQIRKHLNYCKIFLKNDYYYSNEKKFLNTLHYKKISFFYPSIMKNFTLSCNLTKEMRKIFLINFLK
ncbi:pseudouridine synthase [Candidatus Carsonella ruddii]|uniref:Pseudouridine synthase n=1 Tax=Carsonella ruddii TaxID=114186 RepID=A0AAJ6FD22_CARRU|nr:pseudouridine synthase [Candidatus Carsonella ruddii]WGS66619.1 pseudouridine synthase [Candidatus Carsonella ruddii]WGS66816.1 pseudouridine synthase [Candidatus Carsonella ruddii]WGS67008.1 pseudouridine synthase [Candidatus Carsonella ruddii]WGS67199.1 pseudouridine synthase [Candidatus Carsonella ruddii]WMC18216.1 MAG: pseudouridine synthase [Candidatus Carsonella ruddii]